MGAIDIERIEQIEAAAFELIKTAIEEYKDAAALIFRNETDQPQDIAEDILREAVESLGVSSIKERLYGKVDLKKAIYLFLPHAIPIALMVDAKAEKYNGNRTATIQMSQTSMSVRMMRKGSPTNEPGGLKPDFERNGKNLYVVTIVVKFAYNEPVVNTYELKRIILACIPSGKLQEIYNPTAADTIWLVGRNADTRGEDFRVRLNFKKLWEKACWRVHEIGI